MKKVLAENAVLEPELRELCGELDAIQRAKTARKFMRWANQLTESVVLLDPHLVTRVPQPKVPRGFILLNLDKWRQAELRERARLCGCNLHSLLDWAIATVIVELEGRQRIAEIAGVDPRHCWQFVNGNERN